MFFFTNVAWLVSLAVLYCYKWNTVLKTEMRIHNPEVYEKKRINYIRLNSGISNDCLHQRPRSLSSYAFLESLKYVFMDRNLC